jgi:hypothetical protein
MLRAMYRSECNEGECRDNSKDDQHCVSPDQPAQLKDTLIMAGVALKDSSLELKNGRHVASQLGAPIGLSEYLHHEGLASHPRQTGFSP